MSIWYPLTHAGPAIHEYIMHNNINFPGNIYMCHNHINLSGSPGRAQKLSYHLAVLLPATFDDAAESPVSFMRIQPPTAINQGFWGLLPNTRSQINNGEDARHCLNSLLYLKQRLKNQGGHTVLRSNQLLSATMINETHRTGSHLIYKTTRRQWVVILNLGQDVTYVMETH